MTDSPGLEFSLQLQRGSFRLDARGSAPGLGLTGLFGPSGSGKTTLLRCLAGLEPDAVGSVRFRADTWQDGQRGTFVAPHQRRVGYVFQDSRLFPHLDVAGNLHYGRSRSTGSGVPDLDALLGVAALRCRAVNALSGGERRRVAIARALHSNPQLLLLDEPLSGLDGAARDGVSNALRGVSDAMPLAALFVSHDLDEVIRLCDQMIILEHGVVRAAGPIANLLSDPALIGEARCGVIIDARVAGYDSASGLTRLEYDGGTLRVPGEVIAGRVRVHVLARDVSICHTPPQRTSILNVVAVRIESIAIDSDFALVWLASSRTRILARVSRFSMTELGLEPGMEVTAQIKGVAVRPARLG